MSMELKYINHKGAVLDLSDWPFVLQSEGLFDYEWGYNATNTGKRGGHISSFFRDVAEIEAEICIHSLNNDGFAKALNLFFDTVEADISANKPGRLELPGKWYLPCYIIASSENLWRQGIKTDLKHVKIVSEYPWWCLDVAYSFGANYKTDEGGQGEYGFLDYPIDYAIDYTVSATVKIVNNEGIEPASFRLVMYGPVEDPMVKIGGNQYRVETQVGAAEWVTIDSRDRTVLHHTAAGIDLPAFNNREKAHSVFTPIPEGMNHVTEANCFFDITLYVGRSAPIWIL